MGNLIEYLFLFINKLIYNNKTQNIQYIFFIIFKLNNNINILIRYINNKTTVYTWVVLKQINLTNPVKKHFLLNINMIRKLFQKYIMNKKSYH